MTGVSLSATGDFNSEDVQRIREAIYLGPGYLVIRGYLNESQARHCLKFWTTTAGENVSAKYDKAAHLGPSCSNLSVVTPAHALHQFFFWNAPLDRFTYDLAWRLQSLRNRVEGNPASHEFFPHQPKNRRDTQRSTAASARVVITRKHHPIPEHRDSPLNHARVQLELMLSDYGQDYTGGLALRESPWGGEMTNLGEQENLRAGDLVIFRYAVPHEVQAVKTPVNGAGFCRLMVPLDTHLLAPRPERTREKVRRMGDSLKQLAGEFRTELSSSNESIAEDPELQLKKTGERYYSEQSEQLMHIAVREGFDPSEVFYHRGLWARFSLFQDWQTRFLIDAGLKRSDHFLDIGCGLLRLGMPLIEYLDDDRYCGIDPVKQYVDLGKVYMREVVQTRKTFHAAVSSQFEFEQFDRKFDWAIAHSVFNHLSFEQIVECFEKLAAVMRSGGVLVFTVVAGGADRQKTELYAHGTPLTKSRHKDLTFYSDLGKRLGFSVELKHDAAHPTQLVCFARFS